jgi:hypothetical protein
MEMRNYGEVKFYFGIWKNQVVKLDKEDEIEEN